MVGSWAFCAQRGRARLTGWEKNMQQGFAFLHELCWVVEDIRVLPVGDETVVVTLTIQFLRTMASPKWGTRLPRILVRRTCQCADTTLTQLSEQMPMSPATPAKHCGSE